MLDRETLLASNELLFVYTERYGWVCGRCTILHVPDTDGDPFVLTDHVHGEVLHIRRDDPALRVRRARIRHYGR